MPEPTQTLGHVIDGKDVFDGAISERRDPADNRIVVARFHDSTPEVMNQAISAAERAFPAWAELTRRDRGEVIFHMASLLNTAEWRARLQGAMVDEIGKTGLGAALEVEKTVRILRYMAGLAGHAVDMAVHPDQPNASMYTRSQPVGPAAAITPFNFPAAVPAWKIAPALVAGCPVIFKPSPAAPITSRLMVRLFEEAVAMLPEALRKRIPLGVLNLVHGGPDRVRQLVEDSRVQAVSFTGGTAAGQAIYRWSANRPEPLDPLHFTAEMGGQNALVVDVSADLEQAASAAVAGAFGGGGQRCTATSRWVALDPVYDAFMELALAKTRAFKVGPGKDPSSQMEPLVSEAARDNFLAAVAESVRNGMKLLSGGERLQEGVLAHGYFVSPAVLEGDPNNPRHKALRDETFGPVVGACRVQSLEEAIRVVNGVRHQHAASIYTEDLGNAHRFIRGARVGIVHVKNPTTGGDAQIGFGGLGGDTSLGGREMGPDSMKIFLVEKTVDINPGSGVVGPR